MKPETELDPKKALVDLIKRRWQAGVAYKEAQGYIAQWQEYQRFWEADQWPAPTKRTRTWPRPVTNYFASIIEMKVSALTYELPEIYFEPTEAEVRTVPTTTEGLDIEAAVLLSEVAKHLSEAEYVDLPNLLETGLRTAAGVSGTAIWFFPWDNTIRGGTKGKSRFVGDIRGEEIDPADFFPGNPYDPNIQSQPYIIVQERLPLSEVKATYREWASQAVLGMLKPEQPTSEQMVYSHQRVEQEETQYVTLLHHWWKQYDEDEGRMVLNYAVIAQDHLLREERDIYKHGLYPFVAMQWYPRRKSFWGKPEAADLIHNQKERNRLEGMGLMNIYAHGAPKVRYKEGAVDPRDLNNDPYSPVRDRWMGQGWGVDYMDPPQFPSAIPQMIQLLTEGLKDATRAHDAFAGKAPSAELNASAIIALQEAAGITIRPIQRRFYRAMREIGRLWLAHWREFYTEARLIRITGPDNQPAFAWFRGTDFKDMGFDVKVKAGAASPFSRTLYISMLDSMLERRLIPPDLYLEMLPADVFPQFGRLLQKLQQRQQLQQQMVEPEPMLEAGLAPPAPAGLSRDQVREMLANVLAGGG